MLTHPRGDGGWGRGAEGTPLFGVNGRGMCFWRGYGGFQGLESNPTI